jgi:hypothetical protein
LAFEGVDDRLDPSTDGAEFAEPWLLALVVGTQEDRSEFSHQRFEVLADETLRANE